MNAQPPNDPAKGIDVPVVDYLEAGTIDQSYDELFDDAIEDCIEFAIFFIT